MLLPHPSNSNKPIPYLYNHDWVHNIYNDVYIYFPHGEKTGCVNYGPIIDILQRIVLRAITYSTHQKQPPVTKDSKPYNKSVLHSIDQIQWARNNQFGPLLGRPSVADEICQRTNGFLPDLHGEKDFKQFNAVAKNYKPKIRFQPLAAHRHGTDLVSDLVGYILESNIPKDAENAVSYVIDLDNNNKIMPVTKDFDKNNITFLCMADRANYKESYSHLLTIPDRISAYRTLLRQLIDSAKQVINRIDLTPNKSYTEKCDPIQGDPDLLDAYEVCFENKFAMNAESQDFKRCVKILHKIITLCDDLVEIFDGKQHVLTIGDNTFRISHIINKEIAEISKLVYRKSKGDLKFISPGFLYPYVSVLINGSCYGNPDLPYFHHDKLVLNFFAKLSKRCCSSISEKATSFLCPKTAADTDVQLLKKEGLYVAFGLIGMVGSILFTLISMFCLRVRARMIQRQQQLRRRHPHHPDHNLSVWNCCVDCVDVTTSSVDGDGIEMQSLRNPRGNAGQGRPGGSSGGASHRPPPPPGTSGTVGTVHPGGATGTKNYDGRLTTGNTRQ